MIQYTGSRDDDETDLKEKRWMTPFGDQRSDEREIDEDTIRIATQNIGGFPKMDKRGTTKFMRMREESERIDCIGWSEINRNWYKTNAQQSLYERIKPWWNRMKTIHTWLRDHEWPYEHQKGGVSLTLTSDRIAKYGQEKGEDMSGLGRWVWQTIEGRSKTKTVIIQVYRPTRNEKDNGSTYIQQRAASNEENPIKIFDMDLLEVIDGFMEDNFQIIMMGDFNTEINGRSEIVKEFDKRGLRDAIQSRYGHADAPNTHVRGSKPIDAIFISDTINIIKGGYDRGRPEISDHRLIWVDITLDNLLGEDRGDISRPRAKRLQLSNRVVTERFNRNIMRQINQHNMLGKARKLEMEIGEKTEMTGKQKKTYEGLDNQRCRATEYAEKRCCRLPPSEIEFSAELKIALGRAIVYQQVYKKASRKQKINKRWIIDMKWDLGIPDEYFDLPKTEEDAKKESDKAYEEYKAKKQRAPELRAEFLDMLIQQAEDAGEDEKMKYLREIKAKEQSKGIHRRIKMVQGKLKGGGGVRFIHKQREDGTVETIRDKNEMENEIRKANVEKLLAANESPIRNGCLQELLTDHDYERWEAFIRGEINLPDDLNEGTRIWLESFQNIDIQEEDPEITTDSYIKSWNKVREHTSCAPGAMHYGTFKSIKWCRPAAELHAIMARIPIKTGYTPKRWTKSVDSMLPKKNGEWRPHKLRLTSLLMPDFNHNNKILGREAMKWAERKQLLSPEQYGSRKKLSAEKHALNKRLLVDALRIEKRPGVICANDAKACYDRILHFAAYISLRRIGMKKEAIISMLEPIRRMEHVIRTTYGDSDKSYGGEEWESDPSGICQGNGAGSAIWAIVSSPLFKCLREKGYGVELESAIKRTCFQIAGFAFVDDTDTVQTGKRGQQTQQVVQKAQAELNLWEELIRATGGELEGEKSDFAVINYKWTNGDWKYERPNQETKLTVRNKDGSRTELTQLKPSEARRTLGVWQAIDGNEDKQTEKLKEKAREWSRSIMRSSLTRNDVAIGVTTSLYPSLTFGLMATTMSRKQCDDIFTPIRQGALRKTGYPQTMPATIVHGPAKYGGIGIKDLYTLQGIAHLKVLIDEAGSRTPTGSLLRQVIEGHVLEVGRSKSIFKLSYKEIQPELTYSWIQDTIKAADAIGVDIEGEIPKLKTWREDDKLLMDAVNETRGTYITKADRESFQKCRLYLRVNTISDIANGEGTHIMRNAWECTKDWESLSEMAYQWPYQPRPSKKDKEGWKRVLQEIFYVDPRYQSLPIPMGGYYRASRRHTKWLYEVQSESLYNKEGRQWRRWRRTRRRTRTQIYEPTDETEDNAQRQWCVAIVTTIPRTGKIVLEGYAKNGGRNENDGEKGAHMEVDTPGGQQRTLQDVINNIPKNLEWVVETITLPQDNGRQIAEAIIKDRGKCICDGSVKDKLGTASAHFMGVKKENKYKAYNRTPGSDDDVISYRSEMCGILANVVVVNSIATVHDIQEGTVTIGCDNESALWAVCGDADIKAGDSSADIIKIIRHNMEQGPITWQYKHVKGHQDEDNDGVLDEWAKANIEADRDAKKYWTIKHGQGNKSRPRPGRMPGEGWRISINGNPVISNMDEKIYEQAYKEKCVKYWEYKGRIEQGQSENIAWQQQKGALKTMSRARQQWAQKHFCGFEGTNNMLAKRGERTSNLCPSCEKVETHRHILRCQSDRATQAYRNIEREFEHWLKQTTSDEIREAVMAHLLAYREEEDVEDRNYWSQKLKEVSRHQKEVGENAFVEGLLTHGWERIQNEYIQSRESKRNAGRWVRELIKKLWNVSWDMWDSRNGEVHKNKATRKEQIIAQLNKEIMEAHTAGQINTFLPRMEKVFFRKELTEILRGTEYQKRTWLYIARRYNERDRQRVARDRSVLLMREWLEPGSTGNLNKIRTRVTNRSVSDLRTPEGSRRGPVRRRA